MGSALAEVAGNVNFDPLHCKNLDKDAIDFAQLRRDSLEKGSSFSSNVFCL
ncbi:hypothetical protein [Almyronema epifaneia]|uniref:Uncharacterized protein n=1 Tax=Almyronema epifaneia S1 TaxID=2991925 RepID=A0ABW6IJ98_9CYAN